MKNNQFTSDEYRKAFTELCFFLDEFDDNELNKIPAKELNYYYENRDTTYNFECELDEPIEDIKMMHLTEILLANIYEKYLANDEEKQRLSKKRKDYYNKIEYEKSQNYDIDLFNNKRKETKTQETQMIVKKDGILKRIINKIRNIFTNVF